MPNTPKIVTRSETTSSNTTENLNKGSKLTFAEMDSNFLELRNGSIGIVGDDSTGIDIAHGSTLKVTGSNGIQTNVAGDTLTIDGSQLSSIGDLTVIGSTITAPSNADLTLTVAGTGQIVVDGTLTATEVISDLTGTIEFDAKATEAITKGEAVYIAGIDGNTPTVALARANASGTMPGFGIAADDIALNATGKITTFGSLTGLDATNFGETAITFGLGDTVYISSAEAGKLTNVAPTGESNFIQNIGKIERVTPSTNITIKVGGAGRTNATPALNEGNIFIGNASNQSSTVALSEQIKNYKAITVVGDDSTGTDVNIGESFKMAGTQNITTAVSGDTLTITGPDLTSYLTTETDPVVGAVNGIIKANGAGTISAAVAGTDYLVSETNDLTSAVTWANVPDANITQSSVTQHQAALSITESQISDLQSYITDANLTVVGDDSTGVTFSAKDNDDITITGTGGITSTVSGNTITIDGSGVGGDSTGDITFIGSTMLGPSNADVTIEPSGTGDIHLKTDGASHVHIGELVSNNYWSFLPDSGLLRWNSSSGTTALITNNTGGEIGIKGVTNDGDIQLKTLTGGEIIVGPTNLNARITTDGTADLILNTNSGTNSGAITIEDGVNGAIQISPNGTGKIQLDNNYWPNTDGTSGQILTTNGSGVLSWSNNTATVDPITFVGDDSTGTAVNTGETFKIAGTQNVSTAVTGDTLTITGPDLTSYATTSYVDTEDANIASDSLVFTNKTFDANGTGNSISNIEVADMAGSAIVTAAEGIASNNNDTTIPTSAAVKAYADSVGGGGGSATGLTFVGDDSTGTLIADGETVKIAGGTGITTAMSGDTLTITSSGSASTGDFSFTGNEMSTSSSNADMELGTSGTGAIVLKANGGSTSNINFTSSGRYQNANMLYHEDLSHTAGSRRVYGNSSVLRLKLDGTATSSSNARFVGHSSVVDADLNGTDSTNTGGTRGPVGYLAGLDVTNTSATTANLGNMSANYSYGYLYDYSGTAGDINVTNASGFRASPFEVDGMTATATNAYGVHVTSPIQYSGGAGTVTNSYGFYYSHIPGVTFTNDPYSFYTSDDSVRNRPGAFDKFNEYSYNTTHSSGGTYTIDWANGNLQTVTLTSNITGFTMSNFPTSTKQSVGVTLYLVQDGTGSRSMAFSAASGETFKFANGVTTSSVTSANDIQVCYIFSRYDGSSNTFYWTLGPAFS